jgi:hypothetical protein
MVPKERHSGAFSRFSWTGIASSSARFTPPLAGVGFQWIGNHKVTAWDSAKRSLTCASGQQFEYEKLIFATGCEVGQQQLCHRAAPPTTDSAPVSCLCHLWQSLHIPLGEKPGDVKYLRSIAEAEALTEARCSLSHSPVAFLATQLKPPAWVWARRPSNHSVQTRTRWCWAVATLERS